VSALIRQTFAVPPLGCNCSILGDSVSKRAIVVDPGGDAARILETVRALGLTVTAVLHTHAHFDHFLASGEIKQATGAPLYLHADDAELWRALEIQCRMFGVPFSPAPPPDAWLKDDDKIPMDGIEGRALHTPGHTPGSLCFWFPGDQLVLAGDTLFRGGIGRTDLWGGDTRAIERSIRGKLYTLPPDTRVIPGHGPETAIGFEREYNPFISG